MCTNRRGSAAEVIGAVLRLGRASSLGWYLATLAVALLCCCLAISRAEAKSFSPVAEMAANRYGHTVTLLPNGKVLIAGGYNNDHTLSKAEIFDPATGEIVATRDMKAARMQHTATLLADGRVLITGGRSGTATVNSAEIYDPSSNSFKTGTARVQGRVGHSATLLPSGKVLIAGGTNDNTYLPAAEIYDPSTESVTATAPVAAARTGHTATLFPNGKVVLVGGMQHTSYVGTVEVYDPVSGAFSAVPGIESSRYSHSTTLLEDGRLLIAGGRNGNGILRDAQIFDPATSTITAAGGLFSERDDHTATLMPDGTVLIAGGRDGKGYLNSAELFYPEEGSFVPTANMTSVRDISSAILLPNGRVLVAGGWNGSSAACSTEVFDPEPVNTRYRLHLNTTGPGEGKVTFLPGQSCSGSCSQFFAAGARVTLTPVMEDGSLFMGWSGCDSTSGSNCMVTISGNRHVKLLTKEESDQGDPSYPISATAGLHGSIQPAGSSMVERGDNITYTIAPDAGYHVAEVLVDGRRDLGAITSFTFTKVKKPHEIHAEFAPNDAVAITASAGANGSITPSGLVLVPSGSSQDFTITPAAGYQVADVLVDGVSVGALTSYSFTSASSDHTISAVFTPIVYHVEASSGANGGITPDGSVAVSSGQSQQFTIAPHEGFLIADVTVDGVSVGPISSYSFDNVSADHSISASFVQIIYRVDATAGENGTISPAGTSEVASGGTLSYSITPAPGFQVADLLVDGTSVGALQSYSFDSVSSNHTIVASFSHIVYEISAGAGANGTVTPAGVSRVNSGSVLAYTITPATGFQVADVVVDGASAGPVPSYSFSDVSANHSIQATFAPLIFTVNAGAGANGSIDPARATSATYGTALNFTITPSAGFQVADVVVDGVSVGAVPSYLFASVVSDHSIFATFTPIVYQVNATAGPNGSISPAGTSGVNHGSGLDLAITPSEGYRVADVIVDGVSVGVVTSYSFVNVTADHAIVASFTPIVYRISASAGANGSITPAGDSSVNHGSTLGFSITPADGYRVSDVVVDGVSVGAVTIYSFDSVTADHSIAATFTPIVYTIQASSGANGTISPDGAVKVNHGSSVSFSAVPATGFRVADLVVDGVSVGAVTSYSFDSVAADHSIAATFTPIVFTATAAAGDHGSIVPSGQIAVNYGSDLLFSITPDAGFQVSDVLLNGVSLGPVSSYLAAGIDADLSITASFAPIVYQVSATAGDNGSIAPQGVQSVDHGSQITFDIAPDPGFRVADVLVDGVSAGAVTSYSFANVTANHSISAAFTPMVYTVTAIALDNGSIAPAGVNSVVHGAPFNCGITPAPGFKVADVLVDGLSVGAVGSYSFASVTADHTITASFTPIVYSVTAQAGANGSITPDGVTSVEHGSGLSYDITPAPGYQVGDVLVDGISVGGVTVYHFAQVTADHTISASFLPIIYSRTITASAGPGGKIEPAGATVVTRDEIVVYTITPDQGYLIEDILVDGASVGPMTEYVFSEVLTDHTISVTFVKAYTITATATANGSISPSGVLTVHSGASQSFTITPAPGYRVSYLMVNGLAKSGDTSYTFGNVTANQSITPYFAPITHTITSSAGAGGTISPTGTTQIVQGGDMSYSVLPAPGYHVADLLVDGVSVGSLSGYTFTAVTAPHSIEALFSTNPPVTVMASAGANGSIAPEGAVSVLSGASQSFSFTPAPGYRVGEVLVDGVFAGTASSYTFAGISGDHTMTVSFVPDVFSITAISATGGSIEPAGVSVVPRGGGVSYSIAPADGYKLMYVVVDGSSKGAVTSYSFNNVTTNHSIAPIFAPITYTIAASAGQNGSISPSGNVSVNHGSDRTFTITPVAGYHIEEVLVDGVPVGPVTGYTFYAVTAGHSVQASFAPNPVVTVTATSGPNGAISPAGDVTLLSGMSQTFDFLPDSGYRVADVVVDGVSVGARSSYTFSSISAYHTIGVSFTPDVFTIIANNVSNGSIEPAGVTTVPRGGSQTYSITPAEGYKVAYVLVSGSSKGAITSYTFSNVNANQSITANFVPITHEIGASAGAGGSLSPAGVTAVEQGKSQLYTVVPAPGYHVADVLVDGVSVGAVSSYTFSNVMGPHTISATFAENPTVIITASAGPNGSISPTGEVPVVSGTSKTFTFTPAAGYRVAEVLVDGSSVGAPDSYTMAAISAVNHTISVSFTLDTFTITAATVQNGRVEPPGVTTVDRGATITCNIIPDTGYRIGSVTIDGIAKGAIDSFTFSNVIANHTIVPTFVPITFTIGASAGSNGSISPSGTAIVNYGSDRTYTITPFAGYHVTDVVVDGVSVGAVTSYTFSAVTASHTISATFAINPTLSITASAGPNGTISPSGEVQVLSGTNKSFVFTPAAGYRVGEVLVDGVPVALSNTYNFFNITTSHTISVSFVPDTFLLTAVSTPNGTITPAGTVVVDRGASQTFTVTPNAGYKVQFVMVDYSSKGAITSYTFTNVTANHTITPYFALITYPITASAGPNGSVSPSGVSNVPLGGSKSYSITAAAGYHVHDVLVDGVSVGAVTSYTFENVTQAHTISASSAANPAVTITASSGPNGSITPSGAVSLLSGVNKTFTMTPAAGYRVQDVVVDGVSQGARTSYTFVNVSSDHTIEVYFTPDVFTITATAGSNGTIEPLGVSTVARGQSITYTVTPDPGYRVLNLLVDGTYRGAVGSFTFTNVTGNHSISATFALQ